MTASRLAYFDYALAIALAIATFCLFWQTAQFDFVNYDDDVYVYNNQNVAQGITRDSLYSAMTGVTGGNWHPLTMLSHTLDVELFGVSPNGPHVINNIFHALNAGLLFAALLTLTGNRWPAMFAAGLFAWHPLRVESVAWISERKDVLCGLFFMLTLIAYARYARDKSRRNYCLVFASLLLGLLSKSMLVTVPCVLLLLDIWPLRRIRSLCWPDIRPLLLEKVPLFLLVAGFAAITLAAQRSDRAVAGLSVLPLGERAASATFGYATYLRQFFWPRDLAPLYWHPYIKPATGLVPAEVLAAGGLVVLGSAAAVLLRRWGPWITVGWFWYLGMLVPVIGLVQVGWQAHADRYTYLPMIGTIIALVWTVFAVTERSKAFRTAAVGGLVCACGALALQTVLQTRHWRDSESLWKRALAVQPPNSVALNNLAQVAQLSGATDRAMQLYRAAIEVNPDAAEALSNLATLYIAQGNDAAAKPLLRRALPNNPWLIAAYSSLAGIYVREGRLDDALLLYRQAIERDPTYADGFYNIATTLGQQGKFSDAVPFFRKALELHPGDQGAQAALRQAEVLAQIPAGGSPATQPK